MKEGDKKLVAPRLVLPSTA
jgi:hypothetical protein